MFLRKKKINGKEYYYAVKSTRQEGKVKKIERYIGLNKPSDKELKSMDLELSSIKKFLESKEQSIKKIKESYNKKIKSATKDEINNLEQHFITKFTYNTSRIEGSSLSFKDTNMLLNEGITPANKSLKDIKEAENHKQAFIYMKKYAKKRLSINLILKLHNILKKGVTEDAGKFRNGIVYVANLIPINHALVKTELEKIIKTFYKNSKMHPIERVAIFHCDFERIHPFFDGNGRIGRIIMNMMLLSLKYPPIIIQNKNRRKYYNALHKADNGNYLQMVKFFVFELENLYLNSKN